MTEIRTLCIRKEIIEREKQRCYLHGWIDVGITIEIKNFVYYLH